MFRPWLLFGGVLAVVLLAADSSQAQLLGRWRGYYNGSPGYRQGWLMGRFRGYNAPPSYGYQSFYPAEMIAEPNTVTLEVLVPASEAEVLIEGQRTMQRGTVRQFVSPPLTPGKEYTYDIKATWRENGKPVTKTKKVDVRPGQRFTVDLAKAEMKTRELED